MTVAELRAALEALPAWADDATIVLSEDSEGNGFSPLRDVAQGSDEPAAPFGGDFTDKGDCWNGIHRADPLPLNAVCLWPVR